MAYKTLDALRTAGLNLELGLAADTDNVFGDTAARNFFIQRAIAKLWPTVARLTRETFLTTANTMDYTLTTLRDVEVLEIVDPATTPLMGDRIKSWQLIVDEAADPPTLRLLIPATVAGLTIRAIGYVPYAIPATGVTVSDIPPGLEWVVIAGARVEAYRAMVNKFAMFERFQNENRQNALTAADVLELLRQSIREFQQGLHDNARNLSGSKRAMLTTN